MRFVLWSVVHFGWRIHQLEL